MKNLKAIKLLMTMLLAVMMTSVLQAQSWYIPNQNLTSGPAVFADSPPSGYILADSLCTAQIIEADSFCIENSFDFLCREAYIDCVLDTTDIDILIPDSVGVLPALLHPEGTTIPEGYSRPSNQICALEVIQSDPFCLDGTWDALCQLTYDDCIDPRELGCTNIQACNYDSEAIIDDGSCDFFSIWLPNEGISGPAIVICDQTFPPSGYGFADDQECAAQVIAADSTCLDSLWDENCQAQYLICRFGCEDPFIFLPDSVGPAIASCEDTVIEGYTLAFNQACAFEVVLDDPFCINTRWDFLCQSAYDACQCEPFETAPVGLTKSFRPVPFPDGVQDRVQIKWYKALPKVKYSDQDAAMCDIQAWPVRELDPVTGEVTAFIFDGDTINLVDRKKTYGDGSPREIFKWPLFFRADGANNDKRVEPNTRYRFRVRCECGHSGDGLESPWSAEKTFNTPDFDPTTGINTSAGIIDPEQSTAKELGDPSLRFNLFPNPTDGSGINLQIHGEGIGIYQLEVFDITGKAVHAELVNLEKTSLLEVDFDNGPLSKGLYMLNLSKDDSTHRYRFVVR